MKVEYDPKEDQYFESTPFRLVHRSHTLYSTRTEKVCAQSTGLSRN